MYKIMEPNPKPILLELKDPSSLVMCLKCYEKHEVLLQEWKSQQVHNADYKEALVKLSQQDELDNTKDVRREFPSSPPLYPRTRK
jgi:hypothetical protein